MRKYVYTSLTMPFSFKLKSDKILFTLSDTKKNELGILLNLLCVKLLK